LTIFDKSVEKKTENISFLLSQVKSNTPAFIFNSIWQWERERERERGDSDWELAV